MTDAEKERLLELAGLCWDRDWNVDETNVQKFIGCVEGMIAEAVRQARLEEAKAMSEKIDTGDYVHHEPTGENWVVACVDGDRLHWCGWPEGEANLSDCTLIRKATPEERRKRLEEIASMSADCHRKRHAVATLEAERAELERQEVDLLSRICKLLERQQEEERK